MECNVGGVEKNVRFATGAAAILVGLFAPIPRRVRLAVVSLGAVELATALTGYCPVNQLIGRNSCAMSLPEAANKALEQTQEFAE